MLLERGEIVGGYRLEGVLGYGGMGVVYRATQLSLDRPVALKVLNSSLVADQALRERFRREGRHAATLDHPHIVPVYEAGEVEGMLFIAMRLIAGPTLAERMHRGDVSGREALRALGAVASALDAAHAAGFIHRDVKPENVLISATGHPYLADFGVTLGSTSGGITRTGEFVGSLRYAAPEQIAGERLTSACDVYALAGVLFHCLTGRTPYERDSDPALMHAHLHAPPPTVSGLGIAVPPALDAVFTTGMAKDPTQRPNRASAVIGACGEALADMGPEVLERTPALTPLEGKPERIVAPSVKKQPEWPHRPKPVTDVESAMLADATSADRRRAVSQTPAPQRTRRMSRTLGRSSAPSVGLRTRVLVLGATALAIVAAPFLGYTVGQNSDRPRPPSAHTVRSGPVSLTYASGWKPSRDRVLGLALSHALSLRHISGLVLSAGRLDRYAAGVEPAPAVVRARLARPRAERMRFGTRQALIYSGEDSAGGTVWLAFLPDRRGWTAVACRTAATDAPLQRLCAPVAATMRVANSAPVPLGPDLRLARKLNDVVSALRFARNGAQSDLRARRLSVRAAALTRLARAHARAAKRLAAAAPRPQDAPLVRRLQRALTKEATTFRALAGSARARNRRAYARHLGRLRRADRETAAALRGLRHGGYRVAT